MLHALYQNEFQWWTVMFHIMRTCKNCFYLAKEMFNVYRLSYNVKSIVEIQLFVNRSVYESIISTILSRKYYILWVIFFFALTERILSVEC